MTETTPRATAGLQRQVHRSFSIAAAAFMLTLATVLAEYTLVAHGSLALGTYVATGPLGLRLGLLVLSFGALLLAAIRGATVLRRADREGYRDTGAAVLGFCLLGLGLGVLLADLPTIFIS